jgi:lipopolysaccharide export LptBFGC system permease protein LptF
MTYLVSIVLACLVVAAFCLKSNYSGGGGSAAIVVLVLALIFRVLIELVLKRGRK